MKINTSILVILTFILCSCNHDHIAKLSFPGPNYHVQLEIKNHVTGEPLNIIGSSDNQEGAVFFETNKGITWLAGKPEKLKQTDYELVANWKLDQRKVKLIINKEDDIITFSFNTEPSDDILKWGIRIAATENEYFTGLFERVVDGNQQESWKRAISESMNLRGQQVDMIIKPTLSLYCPFYLSSENYGLFFKGTWPGHYDFCSSDPNRVLIEFEGASLNGIIYFSDNPAEIVKAHSLNVGPTVLPPKWAFLPWRWRDNHTHNNTYYDGTPVNAPYNSMVVEDILMMQAYDIPCGVYWVDRPWAKGFMGYEDFEWDPVRFPNAIEMINWIHQNDMKFLLWIAPWVVGDMTAEACEKGYHQPIKPTHWSFDSTKGALLDLTNPEACKWWQENYLEKMLKQGVDGFKLDRSEEIVPETRDVILHDGRTAREVRNEYPVLYVKTVNESCQKIHGDDFVLIPRAGYTGSSKYSGFWGGDIGSPPEGLRAAIIALQRSSIIGFPIWGSDIGGYWHGDLDREVCARWLAFGCFNPIMEFGPTEDRAPWSMKSEPHYDTKLIAIWRLYTKIHTDLAEYSYYLGKIARETGMPPARPLFLMFPDQEESWKDWQTYLYGPDILVSAIWEKGKDKHQLYLPAGEKWKDAWNPEQVYEGGQTINVETPIYKIPVFIREESEINLGDLNNLYKESLEIANTKPNLAKLERTYFN